MRRNVFPRAAAVVAAATVLFAGSAVADELSESQLKVYSYESLRAWKLDKLPEGVPPSLLAGFKVTEAETFVANMERASAADVKKWLEARAKETGPFDYSAYPPDIRYDVERVVRAQRDLLQRAARLPDEEAKKLYVETYKKWNAELKKEVTRSQLRDEIPMTVKLTDAVFDATGEKKLKDPWIDLDTLEGLAVRASSTIAQADALIAAIDAKQLSEDDLRTIVRGGKIPVGAGTTYAEQVKNGLTEVKKKNEARIATLRDTYKARAKAIANAPVRPSIEPAGPPTMGGPKWTSTRAMAAGEGAGFMRGPLNGYGRVYGPQNLGTIVDFGMRAGAFYENSAMTQFELAESFKRQREYQDRVRDWEKNGRKDWERYQNEKWQREMDAERRDMRIRMLLGLPLYGKLSSAAPTTGGSNVGRFASTSGAVYVPVTAKVAEGAGMERL